MPDDVADSVIQEFGVDATDEASIERVLKLHAESIGCVWNLAAPLSVDTAKDPSLAHAVTVGGMGTLVRLSLKYNVPKICFSDSIGSYGAESPRDQVAARWLVECPTQDPGSDYGRQKRECRALLKEFEEAGGDARWAVIPGVLHCEPSWGGGTTEYALDAIQCAAEGSEYTCTVPSETLLPMIFGSDLTRGLMALMDAPKEQLSEPQGGYALAGFSFTPVQLFSLLIAKRPDFRWRSSAESELDPAVPGSAAQFARLWPDSLSAAEAARDLEFRAEVTFEQTVDAIFEAQLTRQTL